MCAAAVDVAGLYFPCDWRDLFFLAFLPQVHCAVLTLLCGRMQGMTRMQVAAAVAGARAREMETAHAGICHSANDTPRAAGTLLMCCCMQTRRPLLLLYNATGGKKAPWLTDLGGRISGCIPSFACRQRAGCTPPPLPAACPQKSVEAASEAPAACAAREVWEESWGFWGLPQVLQTVAAVEQRTRSKRRRPQQRGRTQEQQQHPATAAEEQSQEAFTHQQSRQQRRTAKQQDGETQQQESLCILQEEHQQQHAKTQQPESVCVLQEEDQQQQRQSKTQQQESLRVLQKQARQEEPHETGKRQPQQQQDAAGWSLSYGPEAALRGSGEGKGGAPCQEKDETAAASTLISSWPVVWCWTGTYCCFVIDVPFLLSPLYMNLRGEEGEGKTRNRRYVFVDPRLLQVVLKARKPSSPSQSFDEGRVLPLHRRLPRWELRRAVDAAVAYALQHAPGTLTAGERRAGGDAADLLQPVADGSSGPSRAAAAATTAAASASARSETSDRDGASSSAAATGTTPAATAVVAYEVASAACAEKQQTPSRAPESGDVEADACIPENWGSNRSERAELLLQLLPTTAPILESAAALEVYLCCHVWGLLLRLDAVHRQATYSRSLRPPSEEALAVLRPSDSSSAALVSPPAEPAAALAAAAASASRPPRASAAAATPRAAAVAEEEKEEEQEEARAAGAAAEAAAPAGAAKPAAAGPGATAYETAGARTPEGARGAAASAGRVPQKRAEKEEEAAGGETFDNSPDENCSAAENDEGEDASWLQAQRHLAHIPAPPLFKGRDRAAATLVQTNAWTTASIVWVEDPLFLAFLGITRSALQRKSVVIPCSAVQESVDQTPASSTAGSALCPLLVYGFPGGSEEHRSSAGDAVERQKQPPPLRQKCSRSNGEAFLFYKDAEHLGCPDYAVLLTPAEVRALKVDFAVIAGRSVTPTGLALGASRAFLTHPSYFFAAVGTLVHDLQVLEGFEIDFLSSPRQRIRQLSRRLRRGDAAPQEPVASEPVAGIRSHFEASTPLRGLNDLSKAEWFSSAAWAAAARTVSHCITRSHGLVSLQKNGVWVDLIATPTRLLEVCDPTIFHTTRNCAQED